MWRKTPRILRESAGSEMNTAFDSSDLPQDRTPEKVRQGSPMPFHGKGRVDRDLYDDVSLCCCLTHSSESEGSLCFHLHILSFHPLHYYTGGLPTTETPPPLPPPPDLHSFNALHVSADDWLEIRGGD
ncbi:hypothetical protein OIU84_002059 [Salix udensis]|uniref:Uncharacterized protein n=1 Tax=Salix udensis TaxID=889485 RepID=A0AAD6K8L1_9ROSI|nr:hypothetical protein OIU84_002059 [Salix udensis]